MLSVEMVLQGHRASCVLEMLYICNLLVLLVGVFGRSSCGILCMCPQLISMALW